VAEESLVGNLIENLVESLPEAVKVVVPRDPRAEHWRKKGLVGCQIRTTKNTLFVTRFCW